MELVNIHNFRTSAGFVPDLPAEDLPAGALTGGYNFVVGSKGLEKTTGFADLSLVPDNTPHALFYQPIKSEESLLVTAGDTSVKFFDGLTVTDVTRLLGPYNANADTAPWSITDLNGLSCLNNSGDKIQYVDGTGILADLPNLQPNTQFQRITSYKNFLFGLGVSEDAGVTWNPHRLIWSTPADPGAVPSSWDYSLTTNKAGDNILPSRLDIRDALVLGEVLFIYKGDSVFAVEFTGGSYVFNFKKRFSAFGILSSNCVVEFDNKHFVITEEDFRVHDGFKADPVGTDIIKDYFFETLDKENYKKTFVVANIVKSQIWICYPTVGNSSPDTALIWNWKKNTWGIKRFAKPVIAGVYAERAAPTPRTFATVTGTYYQKGNFTDTYFRDLEAQLTFIGTGNDPIIGESNDGLDFEVEQEILLERTALPLGPLTRDGVIVPDFKQVKIIGEVWFYGTFSGPFEVQLGGQETLSQEIVWEDYITLDPSVSRKIDVMFSTVFAAIRIKSSQSNFYLNKVEFRFAQEGEQYGFGQ